MMSNPSGAKRGPGGNRLCRWCGTEVVKPRICWCSDGCVHEYRIRSHSGYARSQVRKRDKGICSECGLDTIKLRRDMGRGTLEQQRQRMVWFGIKPSSHVPTLWEADHILPVAEGGGACGLENYRTLCLWHHKAATAKLHKRLAVARKAAKRAATTTLFNRPKPK